MLGPILLSTDATEDTYKHFHTHLKWRLNQEEIQGVMFNEDNFVFGSDQEKALINAMKCFSKSYSFRVCLLHTNEYPRALGSALTICFKNLLILKSVYSFNCISVKILSNCCL